MKIAFIGQKGIPAAGGGVERYVEDLAVRLAARGQEVLAYTRQPYTDKNLKEYRGVKLVSLPSLKTKHTEAISHTFLSVIHAACKRVDVIHFQSIGSALTIWLPKLIHPKVKIVSTLQSKDYEHGKWGAFAKFSLKLGERLMCRLSDQVIVVTRPMADYVKREYGLDAKFAPNGANVYDYSGSDKLSEWGLKPQGYIVAISRLIRHKGLNCLVEAYKQLGDAAMPLVIVGEGAFTDDYIAELKALASNANIIFTGKQTGNKLAQLYDNAYLFVQPSESEGLSLALLEAMSRGVPVLVSDIPENLEPVRENGLVFAVNSVDDLREKLNFALNEPEILKEKAVLAQVNVRKNYNWEDIADEVALTYFLAAAGGRQTMIEPTVAEILS